MASAEKTFKKIIEIFIRTINNNTLKKYPAWLLNFTEQMGCGAVDAVWPF